MTLRKVTRGDDLDISAEFYNAAIDAIDFCKKQMRMLPGDSIPDLPFGIIKVKNTSGATVPRYGVLSIDGLSNKGDTQFETVRPPLLFTGGKVTAKTGLFAILADPVNQNESGRGVIAGTIPGKVKISDESHQYAELDLETPGQLRSCAFGPARIIWKGEKTGQTWCLLWLDGGSGTIGYNGPFAVSIKDGKLSVSAGFLNCNGSNYQSVPATDGIPPISGYLCVCCSPNLKGGWTKPEVKIAQPGFEAYPVAEITVKDGAISIRQYPVAVAVVMVSKPCPLARLP